MKNIHLLPTNQPSKYVTNYMEQTMQWQLFGITSEEEIKEGDWILDIELNRIEQCLYSGTFRNWKKIILTTDQDLIKDGIQAIPDEFLEWFVKNPSCEEVETFIDTMGCTLENCDANPCINYKIIIPKEEPLIEFTNTNDFTSMVYNPTDEKGRLMTYWGGLEEPKTNLDRLPFPELVKELAEYYKNIPLVEETKQETLEESAEKQDHTLVVEYCAFIEGAKWQQNDCVQFINKLEDDSFDGWSEEAINGYLTACITIKNKLKLK